MRQRNSQVRLGEAGPCIGPALRCSSFTQVAKVPLLASLCATPAKPPAGETRPPSSLRCPGNGPKVNKSGGWDNGSSVAPSQLSAAPIPILGANWMVGSPAESLPSEASKNTNLPDLCTKQHCTYDTTRHSVPPPTLRYQVQNSSNLSLVPEALDCLCTHFRVATSILFSHSWVYHPVAPFRPLGVIPGILAAGVAAPG